MRWQASGNSRSCTSSMRRLYASSLRRLRRFLSDSHWGSDLPPEMVYTYSSGSAGYQGFDSRMLKFCYLPPETELTYGKQQRDRGARYCGLGF